MEALPKRVRSVACGSNKGLSTPKAGAGDFNMKWAAGVPVHNFYADQRLDEGSLKAWIQEKRNTMSISAKIESRILVLADRDIARVPREELGVLKC